MTFESESSPENSLRTLFLMISEKLIIIIAFANESFLSSGIKNPSIEFFTDLYYGT